MEGAERERGRRKKGGRKEDLEILTMHEEIEAKER